jgi:hypothetical protein
VRGLRQDKRTQLGCDRPAGMNAITPKARVQKPLMWIDKSGGNKVADLRGDATH